MITAEQVSGLVKLSGQIQNPLLSYNCAAIVSKLEMSGNIISVQYKMSNSLLSVVYYICIISCFSAPVPLEEVIELLRPHHTTMLEYLLVFLKKRDVKFQQLCIVTISNLKKGLYLYI